jgi:hypothetical protein
MKTFNRVHWKAMSIPKQGNRPSENEDAFLPVFDHHTYAEQTDFTCALADGATQTSFSGLWARLLVKEAVARGLPDSSWQEVVTSARELWNAELSKIKLPWHAEEKVRQGAFSTLLWFGFRFPDLKAKTPLTWQALAVGDTCLFQIRKRAAIQIVPQLTSQDFGNHPVLLSSNPEANGALTSPGSPVFYEGSWAPGDGFLLMTDALSAWFLRETERGNTPMLSLEEQFLFPKDRQEKFNAWITRLREAGELKNDDTSILWAGTDPKLSSRT